MGKARDKFQHEVAEVMTQWRLGTIPFRRDGSREVETIRSGIAEILELRLRVAFAPIFRTLMRMEGQLEVLADFRESRYAPSTRTGRPKIQTRF